MSGVTVQNETPPMSRRESLVYAWQGIKTLGKYTGIAVTLSFLLSGCGDASSPPPSPEDALKTAGQIGGGIVDGAGKTAAQACKTYGQKAGVVGQCNDLQAAVDQSIKAPVVNAAEGIKKEAEKKAAEVAAAAQSAAKVPDAAEKVDAGITTLDKVGSPKK